MSAARPNLLVILADQLRRQALSLHGEPDLRTPHLDALAGDGVAFDAACATYPICVPYRFTFMTGWHAHTRLVPGIEFRMSPAERTLADEFNDAGYETVYIGKWHLDGGHGRLGSARQVNRTPVPRARQGRWQRWYGFELRNDPFDTCYFVDDDPTPQPIDGYQTDGLTDLAIEHLSQRADDAPPFCMVVSVEPPHPPYSAPPDLEAAWAGRALTLPANVDDGGDAALRDTILQRRRTYNAMVQNLDDNVGRLTAALQELGLADDTVVVFTADHGELGGAHGLHSKQYPYEESVGVPLIVRDPRAHGGGRRLADPTCTEDLFPTFLGLCGLPARPDLPGLDLSGLIRGDVDALDREGVLLEFIGELRANQPFYDAVWRGLRTRHGKYTVRGDNETGGAPWQFFDLRVDPLEQDNRVDDPDHADVVDRHHRLLAEALRRTGDHFVLPPARGAPGVNAWMDPS